MSTGQTEIAELVGVGRTADVALCAGVGASPAVVLMIPKGAHADKSSKNASSAIKRRGVCIRVCYLSCIALPMKLVTEPTCHLAFLIIYYVHINDLMMSSRSDDCITLV